MLARPKAVPFYVLGFIFTSSLIGSLLVLASRPAEAQVGSDAKSASEQSVDSPQACDPTWTAVSGLPDVGGRFSLLTDLAVLSSQNIWAVGFVENEDGTAVNNLAVHWDGTRWSVVDTPDPLAVPQLGGLVAIDAIAHDDIWAVAGNCIALHYDGSSWEAIYLPCSGSNGEQVEDVVAVASDDVWAVGSQKDETRVDRTLIMHWDGVRWTKVNSPNANDRYNQLTSIDAAAANDIWAVGQYIKEGTTQTLILHWDGISWSIVPSPNPSTYFTNLNAVEVVSANDVWAGGFSGETKPLMLHWDGTSWTRIPTPILHNELKHNIYDIEAIATNDVWAVGTGPTANGNLVFHWDGSTWRAVSPTRDNADHYESQGIDALNTGDVWTVGRSHNKIGAEHYISPCANCSLHFQDVPGQNTFYPYVNCLACRDILGGYACGGPGEPCNKFSEPYFRPGAETTRGQIAKIVAQAAGITDDPGPQIYADVAPGSTFYDFINRLSRRGYMSGYACGSNEQEPCNRQEHPYFRPGANATRGQLAKIVSNAAMFDEAITGQTYEDVPTDAPFYPYIERLSSRYVIGGYPCGTAPESCGEPPRPYFRPNNNVTRGQASKIVGNTFYPDCRPAARK